MSPWFRVFIYIWTLPWDLVSWLAILFIRLFWGQKLEWESAPGQGSPVLTVDLLPDSWPCRTWYAVRRNGMKVPVSPSKQDRFGKFVTWGGTTLGPHAIMYGPGQRVAGKWGPTQHHEHRHSKQGEAAMQLSFLYSIPVFIYAMLTSSLLWAVSLAVWTLGFIATVVTALLSALLRGERGYRGSYLEEAAYDSTSLFQQKRG